MKKVRGILGLSVVLCFSLLAQNNVVSLPIGLQCKMAGDALKQIKEVFSQSKQSKQLIPLVKEHILQVSRLRKRIHNGNDDYVEEELSDLQSYVTDYKDLSELVIKDEMRAFQRMLLQKKALLTLLHEFELHQLLYGMKERIPLLVTGVPILNNEKEKVPVEVSLEAIRESLEESKSVFSEHKESAPLAAMVGQELSVLKKLKKKEEKKELSPGALKDLYYFAQDYEQLADLIDMRKVKEFREALLEKQLFHKRFLQMLFVRTQNRTALIALAIVGAAVLGAGLFALFAR